MLLNASGCLDALTAPAVARTLDAFVTKTITPEPREGNPPVRIAETESGMLNSIGLANPGRDRFLMGKRLKVRQVRSQIGGKQNQRDTLRSLGLKRLGDVVVKEDRPEIRGMVSTVSHLVTVEEVD